MAQTLYAPWRIEYIRQVSDGPKECFLCAAARSPEQDEANLVLLRGATCLLMLNRYPYVNGHLLVAPYRHAPTLVECEPAERAEMMELVMAGQKLLSAAMNPQGFNVGINLGKCAGAGLPGHLHAHIVPRWNGDVNFMTVIGRVGVIPQATEEAFGMLREAMGRVLGS